ncbi:MAG: AraC family transcriptional regulator [Bacteroidota bacterium]
MNIEQQLIFLFSALGGINGALLSIYFLIVKKEKRRSDYFLGALILMLSVRTIKSVFLHFNGSLFGAFIQVGLTACLLIGPFLFLYVNSMTASKDQKPIHWLWHVVPFVVGISVFGWYYPYYEYRPLWYGFIEGIYKQWLLYILVSGYLLLPVFRKMIKREKLEDHEFWMVNIFAGTGIVWLAYDTSNYTSYIVGALSFTFLLYTDILLWFYKSRNKAIAKDTPVKYLNSTLSESEVQEHMQRLKALMEQQKRYTDTDLTLEKLSQQLGLGRKELSQVINQSTGHNYASYIAQLRVEEAKQLLLSSDHQHLKISTIAFDSGFNSVSSFNHNFRKIVGMTAKEYRAGKSQSLQA